MSDDWAKHWPISNAKPKSARRKCRRHKEGKSMASIRHNRRKVADRPSLDDIFSGPDEFGLLDVPALRVGRSAPLEITNFEEISSFVDEHGRAPSDDGALAEKLL